MVEKTVQTSQILQQALNLIKQSKLSDAKKLCVAVINQQQNNHRAFYLLGKILFLEGSFTEAIKCMAMAIKISPNNLDYIESLADFQLQAGLFNAAADNYNIVVKHNPKNQNARYQLSRAYFNLYELDEASKQLDILEKEGMNTPAVMFMRSKVLYDQGKRKEALKLDLKVEKEAPENIAVSAHAGMVQLSLGKLKDGFERYEKRWELYENGTLDPKSETVRILNFLKNKSVPLWDGKTLRGKNVLVWSEQGIGDSVMLASMVPEIAKNAKHVRLLMPNRLHSLLKNSFGKKVEVVKELNFKNEKVDCHIPIGYPAKFYRTALNKFPKHKGYIDIDKKSIKEFQDKFAALNKKNLNVGISWHTTGSGDNFQKAKAKERCINLNELEKLLKTKKCNFINLQYGNHESAIEEFTKKNKIDIYRDSDVDPLKDLYNFAAQISALDLVITIDNSTAHIAGALGVPVWNLLPKNAEWRWMEDSKGTSPWYPSMKLFRQHKNGDWNKVIDEVTKELKKLAQ